MVRVVTELTVTESGQLSEYENTIEQGMGTFFGVGSALLAIREGRLYRQTFKTFDAYCKERWDMGKAYAHRLIESYEVQKDLSPIGDKDTPSLLPANEAQARPLTPVPDEDRAEVWTEVVKRAPKDDEGKPMVTAAHVKTVVDAWRSDDEDDTHEADENVVEEEEVWYDEDGNEIPDHCRPVFDGDGLFDGAIGHIKELRAAVEVLTESPPGIFVGRTGVKRLLQEIETIIDGERPYGLCPLCQGHGCDDCMETGAVTKARYAQSRDGECADVLEVEAGDDA